ncbi:polyribonucleotide nucleotidyltransferase [Heliophilum fasciatum]|uniref:Polyribonucleotide nucleotidyltransferase n=1 Tax=Heliophilum fasciatum TaxID=35700 RepID=A0A4R2RX19_9FIRM|nr:polyribonucleotide nucleotidyltransferase [Heliophilum fasciatum]TCP64541.1 polyribonucleotide nucleotidyltransferase [Heliophilum fasciatum]
MQTFSMEIGGRTLSIETGRVAKQAGGSVMARYGDTVVLVAATASKEPRPGIDFFPLTVDYEERLYAVGKIPGGFIKREGRPTEKAILSSRLIDRPIRPLFPKGFRNDVQVVATVLSVDQDCQPEIVAMIGASAALMLSDVPFEGPIGGVIVGRIDGQLVINPSVQEAEKSDMHLVVAGTKDAVMMVEAGANEVPEDEMIEAIMFGHDQIRQIVEFQESIAATSGKEKRELKLHAVDEELAARVREFAQEQLEAAVRNPEKLARQDDISRVNQATLDALLPDFPDQEKSIREVLESIVKKIVRRMITVEKARPDGRDLTEIRPITVEVGILPRTHGSGLFTRGQTQVLNICTLGTISDLQILDGLGMEESKRYIHHYNFPSYSVGETRPMRGPGRREIGHGALAERALLPVIPSEEQFPYTIRLVSEVLESNGSSSMASVCGSTLSLMNAGVPIKAPVAGIAMGLVKDDEHYAILSDIQGMEDHLGDMDFKVAGTAQGITALQMDIKIKGVDRAILQQAMSQAKEGRLFILNKMLDVIPAPAKEMSPYAPRIITMQIDPDKIREVIGPGGKVINKIIAETGVKIDIEDDGRIFIAATDDEAAQKAVKIIQSITAEVEVGMVYTGRVTRLMNFGAFVEVLPGKEGLVHISQLAEERVAKVEDVVNVGDVITVKVTEIDKQGRVNLSRREVLRAAQGNGETTATPRPARPAGNDRQPRS